VRFPTILFDLDGTIIDSIELIMESYRHTMRRHRGACPPDEVFLAGIGTPLRVQFAQFTSDDGELAAMITTYREWNLSNHDRMVVAYPGAVDALRKLKAGGSRLGLVTSKNLGGVRKGLALVGLEDVFESFVTADRLEESKPDPRPVLTALEDLDASTESALFVGDSPHDIAAGRRAGVKTAACLWGPFGRERLAEERPDFWLSSFADLIALCNRPAPAAASAAF
jgi:pyrophosphatase PpaX